MSERREFLKTMSLLSVGVVPGAASSRESEDDQNTNQTLRPMTIPARSTPQTNRPFSAEVQGPPDQAMNLFGAKRPDDWAKVKDLVASALSSHTQSGPIRDWLKPFMTTFDQRARDVVANAHNKLLLSPDQWSHSTPPVKQFRYEPQLFDVSLRAAANQLDRCLAYRTEMGDYETAGVNIGLSYLTFLKVRPLQLALVQQSNYSDLTALERNNAQLTVDKYSQLWDLNKYTGVDEVEVAGLRQDALGELAEASLLTDKENLRSSMLEEQFRIQTDAQLAQYTRYFGVGSSSNYSERYLRLSRLLEEDLADAYCSLYSAAKGIKSLFNTAASSSFLDFPLTPTTSVDVEIFPLSTNQAIDLWVDKFADPSSISAASAKHVEILDALVLWCRGIMRELDRRSQYETEFTVSVQLPKPTNGGLSFALDETILPSFMKDKPLRLIGLGLSVQHDDNDSLPVVGATPFPHPAQAQLSNSNAWGNTAAEDFEGEKQRIKELVHYRTAKVTATIRTPPPKVADVEYYRPPVILTNVRLAGGMSGDYEPDMAFDLSCKNSYPLKAKWEIQLEQKTVSPVLDVKMADALDPWKWVNGMILHLRLRGRPS